MLVPLSCRVSVVWITAMDMEKNCFRLYLITTYKESYIEFSYLMKNYPTRLLEKKTELNRTFFHAYINCSKIIKEMLMYLILYEIQKNIKNR